MKAAGYFPMFFGLAMLVLSTTGCDKTPTAGDENKRVTENTKVAEAYAALEDQFFAASQNPLRTSADFDRLDFTEAEKLYIEAVAADPENTTANFGAGFTRMLTVYADTIVSNAVKRWESRDGSPMLNFGIPGTQDMKLPTNIAAWNIVKIIQTAVSDPPTIGEMQVIMRDRVLPRINYALDRFAVVEKNQTFEFEISGKMQGNTERKPLYLDLTEVYVMDALLQGMKAIVEQFLVFRFELSAYTTNAIVEAIRQDNTTFFVLAPDGAGRAISVKSSLISMIGRYRSAFSFLNGETDNQDDDIIKKADIPGLPFFDKLETSLTGVYSIDATSLFDYAGLDEPDKTIKVSLGSFFANLPQYPKQAWLPSYCVDTTAYGNLQWHWTQKDYGSFTFPDPTLSGLLPNMTNEKLKRLLFLDEHFSWRLYLFLYDANGMLIYSDSLALLINGKAYSRKKTFETSDWGYARSMVFAIIENENFPVELFMSRDGQRVPFSMDKQMIVRYQRSDHLLADATLAHQNITAQVLSSPLRVELDLREYAIFKIERAVGPGPFSVIDSLYTGHYIDYGVLAATSYRYRAQRLHVSPWYSPDYVASLPNNYTNTVSATTP